MVKIEPCQHLTVMIQSLLNNLAFIEPIRLSLTSGMTSKTNLQPPESISKACFEPHVSTSIGLNRSYYKNENSTMIQLLSDQLDSLQPLG